ncbi:GntR family transcriptional regulator [Brevibacterium atlanticum]|uniref:GntR family transcriptional regulator n=1 Tax=Brevibacterium atlanticum TaxID=2697563 RepID=UPI001D1836E2|nr:GntR family transcriptional regulator [Brevibacterium atlanticum]
MDRARPQAQSLREHALAIIRDAITAGDLAEDRIYSAAGLAKELGMSLSPVREAMMSLVTEGTVEAVPNRGFRLVPITEDDLEEIIRIRVLLAVPAVRNLCELAAAGSAEVAPGVTITEALSRLREHAEATIVAAESGDVPEFYTRDRRFHEALLEYGLGRRAAEISLRLRDQSRLFNVRKQIDDIAVDSARELPRIIDLIESEEADAAAELVTGNLYFFRRGSS